MPRILFIGFGMEPFMRGGAITYQESIIEALQASGWEVFFYLSAPRYTYKDKPRLRRWSKKGVNILEIVDPPYHYGHYYSPLLQCSNPEIERLSKEVFEEVNPDLVHIHELQFHTASLIDIIVDERIPTIKTMHNYYDLCPEGNLMYKGNEFCTDYGNGSRCRVCLSNKPIFFTNFMLRLGQVLPVKMYDCLHNVYLNIKKIKSQKTEEINEFECVALYHAEEYRYRRCFFVEQLNKLDLIHCSSSRSADIFYGYGIPREKLQVIPLSVKKQNNIKLKAVRTPKLPVVFGFIGGKSFHKGYHVLIDAFSRLDQTKVRLIIWGDSETDTACRSFNVEYRDNYNDKEINKVFKEVDVFVVPSVWEEIFGIIGIECRTARVPVIGSKIGGIPEWLKDGESGFLVPPNKPEELALTMERFVNDSAIISKIQQQIKPWKGFDEHVDEMLELYISIMERKPPTL